MARVSCAREADVSPAGRRAKVADSLYGPSDAKFLLASVRALQVSALVTLQGIELAALDTTAVAASFHTGRRHVTVTSETHTISKSAEASFLESLASVCTTNHKSVLARI